MIDTSALIAYVNHEPGGERVPVMSGDAVISTVNYAETVSVMTTRGLSRDEVREQLSAIVLEVVDFDEETAEAAGLLIKKTKRFGLSLGDRACLAAAQRERIPVMTADRSWGGLGLELDIQFIR